MSSINNKDEDEDDYVAKPPGNLPIELIENEHRLLHKLEQHAIALYQASLDDNDAIMTISRDGMLEVSTAILQLLSLIRARKIVS